MLYGKYQFLCRFENEATLPYYKGSTFRGVFGRALKKVVCALKRQECNQCLLRERCVYVHVFETQIPAGEAPEGSKMPPPHPFVIEPPLTPETQFPEGAAFDFNLLLFGQTNNNLPYFIYAFDQMGRIGIGKKINGKRGQFVLKKVKMGGRTIYSEKEEKLRMYESPEELVLSETNGTRSGDCQLKVILETPLRLKFENRLKADLPFHVLVRTMLRRISSLMNCYGNGEPPLDYRGFVKRAESIRIVEDNLNWFDWRRYSLRQEKSMLMGGMVGSVVYEGKIDEYLSLLEFCSKVHLGKQTSFGLGKIKTEIM